MLLTARFDIRMLTHVKVFVMCLLKAILTIAMKCKIVHVINYIKKQLLTFSNVVKMSFVF